MLRCGSCKACLEFEQRLNNFLRSFPIQDVAKAESDFRKQVACFCEAVLEEQKHPDSELSEISAGLAGMTLDLLSLGNVVALQRDAAALDQFNTEASSCSVVAFFHEAQGRATPYPGFG